MVEKYRIIHVLNQFFAGIGGEDKANFQPRLMPGAQGPGRLIEKLFPEVDVVTTVIFGDNYIVEKGESAITEILTQLEKSFYRDCRPAPPTAARGPGFQCRALRSWLRCHLPGRRRAFCNPVGNRHV